MEEKMEPYRTSTKDRPYIHKKFPSRLVHRRAAESVACHVSHVVSRLGAVHGERVSSKFCFVAVACVFLDLFVDVYLELCLQ